MLTTGTYADYKWLQIDISLSYFLRRCPDAVVGNYLAITSVDSGSFVPARSDFEVGWTESSGIAYSPLISSIEALPPDCCCRECCGFDEWYLFTTPPPPLGTLCHSDVFRTEIAPPNVFAFINFGSFSLCDPIMTPVTDLFWRQIAWIHPDAYLGDGQEWFVFAARDSGRFAAVEDVLRKVPDNYTYRN